ncbi:DUF3301 domain-containing protein [Pseudomonas neustonica]|uniref:DUF3301 domain-containing protein n=1 Tax=Pseudomonas neustonica TaxID=2487346 RepID=A0ABX9XPC7_9PSED|nr:MULTISPECIES: DUF3301 domain-containing protein [Pseudomonas]ROZ86049.1 DUF3301 domain-containing protein [Pseudomonas sp. SSM44]ROZ87774.1 DUF3301 domain-containing protein [Pseudomonas neustonica]
MFNLGHVALLMLLLLIGWWLLRNLGLRDQAMRLVRNHCQRSDVQLLDDSIALTGMRIARNRRGRPGLVRRYAFEFTVTGEHRYDGYIDLHGQQLLHLEMAPHPFPGGDSDQQAKEQPTATLHRMH